MATESPPTAAATTSEPSTTPQPKRYRSIFELPSDFFDACALLSPSFHTQTILLTQHQPLLQLPQNAPVFSRWTCHTCNSEFDSLLEQRIHFKSDIHRINVKLSIAGKAIVNEDDFDELTSDLLKDCDISSISGSEDEEDNASVLRNDSHKGLSGSGKQKMFVQLQTGERVSVWRSLILNESESFIYESDKGSFVDNPGQCLSEKAVIERLNFLICEGRDGSHLRIVLLVSGGHFAGCVFDGSLVVAHKTFHRYVVRAKAGKKQSSKDGGGRAIHSAGASLRRYNELALRKDIQELFAAWKPYFDVSSCVFVHAPSSSRQMLFDGDRPYFSYQHCAIRNIPLSVRRPTLKEAKRIYNQLTQIGYEVDEEKILPHIEDDLVSSSSTITDSKSESTGNDPDSNRKETAEASSRHKAPEEQFLARETDSEVVQMTTPLHEAAKSGDTNKVLELLEQGMDPCIKDERGRTPYTVANEKEVRNAFRRFMASNIDRWDWHAANVPSALTKEMEESQAAKQAEKDAKRKARAKELKKIRKAREKKCQAQETSDQNDGAVAHNEIATCSVKGKAQPIGKSTMPAEEKKKSVLDIEREKRAAAAEKRMAAAAAALKAEGSGSNPVPSTAQSRSVLVSSETCSCCNASLAGKVPFHRYNYKYCSSSCMHVHREVLEDG